MVNWPMPRTCAVRLLGGFLVEVDGVAVPADAWRHRRGADLVKLLALAPEHRVHREQLMDRLWPSRDQVPIPFDGRCRPERGPPGCLHCACG